MSTIGFVPFKETARSREAEWLTDYLGVEVRVVNMVPSWNHSPPRQLPTFERLTRALEPLLPLPAVVLEGPGAFLWAACLRAAGFAGSVTVLPGVKPRGWRDVLAVNVYRQFADRRDRVYVGSRPSASVYAALEVETDVGDPYGVDERLFRLRPEAERVRSELSIPPGRILLYAGRAQPDRDLHCFLQVGLKARLLFPDLILVVASRVVDDKYLAAERTYLNQISGVHFVAATEPRQMADLYNIADVFLSASTRLETFGRDPAQALICGCPSVGPRYDGFAEVLAQPGGTIVEPTVDPTDGTPCADEAGLLRAVYDTLTASRRPTREDIADAARRRFGRSYTMGMLRNLLDGSTRRPGTGVAPAGLKLPAPWCARLTDLAQQKPDEALAWCWEQAEHDRLARHDGGFAKQVRRSLSVPTLRSPPAPRGHGAAPGW
jgi:glycosyltransferase involved in cell wall biosynthesis